MTGRKIMSAVLAVTAAVLLIGCRVTEKTNVPDGTAYMETASLAEIPMGTADNGKQETLCRIKMPEEYLFLPLYTGRNGQEGNRPAPDGTESLSAFIKKGCFEKDADAPSVVILNAPGKKHDDYTFAVVRAEQVSAGSEKKLFPEGMETGTQTDHKAYIYRTEGPFDICMVYEINDRWSLLIENSGDLKDRMSLKEIGEKWYGMITPAGE